MNKDQKLLAEAYSRILKEANLEAMTPEEREAYEAELDKKESYKDYLQRHNEESAVLDSTVDLEAIADFLNQNDVWSGAPAKGSGGWYVHNSEVVNDDAEGGYTGISVKLVPGNKGLTAYNKKSESTLFPWPLKASDVEAYMQHSAAELHDEGEEGSNDFIEQIKAKAGTKNYYYFGRTEDGKMYAIIAEFDRYSDGDRWIDEEDYYYQAEGEEKGKYISDEKAKALIKQIAVNYADLNKHIPSEVLEFYRASKY
jgi:hypothetical protein